MEIKNLAQQYIYWPEVKNKYQSNIDMSEVKLTDLSPMFKERLNSSETIVTDSIIRFYSLNETLARLRQQENEVLDVKALDLYQDYTNELEATSKNLLTYIFMICMMESRHCKDFKRYRSIESNLVESDTYYDGNEEQRAAIKKEVEEQVAKQHEEFAREYKETMSNDENSETEVFDILKFNGIYALSKYISSFGGSSRNHIKNEFLPLLDKEPYNTLTIKDAFVYLKTIFNRNHFAGGYGGRPWGAIAEHANKFIQGKINAEVFIDQAFSLEHNGGQIFNKDILFSQEDYNYWNIFNMDFNTTRVASHKLVNSQICLNAQHQGQLLTLLKYDYKGYSYIRGLEEEEQLKNLKQLELIPPNTLQSQLRSFLHSAKDTIDLFDAVFGNFKNRNEEFYEKIKQFNIITPELDTFSIINQCTRGDRNGVVELDETHRMYQSFVNHVIVTGNRKAKIKNVESAPYEYSFDYLNTKEIPQNKMHKEILGNKAFGLAEMHEMDLPVPNALVFPATNAAGFFKEKGKWINQLRPELNKITEFFKDSEGNPIPCSVRSGSAISMPGMMDTILNVGIDDSNYDYFCEKMGKEVVNESVIKFMGLFTKSLLGESKSFSTSFPKALFQFREILNRHKIAQTYDGLFPLNARQQYKWCLQAVFTSWHSERATAYRDYQNISHDIGTAAIVQQMVFGNLNDKSCTGVVFSRDCISGERGIIGEFLPKAQGEDVVSGAVTPLNIIHLEKFNKRAYHELLSICERLEKDTGDIQDIEFTIENKKLYILQKRKAVCSAIAQTKLNQELYSLGLIDEKQMLSAIKIDNLISKDVIDSSNNQPIGEGLIGNPGVMRGIVIRHERDMERYSLLYALHKEDNNFGWIFYAPETSPEHAPIMIKTQAFITSNGGFTSHAAILARSWDKPCVVGMGNVNNPYFESGTIVTLDANNGKLYADILPLKETNNNEINKMVDNIINYHKIDLSEMEKNNPFEKTINEINSKQSWMEEYPNTQIVVTKEETQPKMGKFLSLGQKIALMIVKAEEVQQKANKAKVGVAPKLIEDLIKKEETSYNDITGETYIKYEEEVEKKESSLMTKLEPYNANIDPYNVRYVEYDQYREAVKNNKKRHTI